MDIHGICENVYRNLPGKSAATYMQRSKVSNCVDRFRLFSSPLFVFKLNFILNTLSTRNPGKMQRPGTAPAAVKNGPSSRSSNQPKTFSLDLEKLGLESSEAENEMPELADTNVDEIMTEPVVLPKRRQSYKPHTYLGPTTCRQLAVNSLAPSTRRQLLQCTFKTHKRSIEL